MPTITKKMLQEAEQVAKNAAQSIKDCNDAIRLAGHLDLDESTLVNPYGCSIWFTTQKREDVEKIMTLCPVGKVWTKRDSGEQIVYSVWLDSDKEICIYAMGEALPPTCVVEEIDVVVPAQPERTERKKVLKCKQPPLPTATGEPPLCVPVGE